MKSLIYFILSIPLFLITIYSCSNDDIKTYDGVKAGLIIQEVQYTDVYGNPVLYKDSSTYSFAGASSQTTSMKVLLHVRAIGFMVNYDRPYILKLDPTTSNAVEGEDFNLTGNDFTIKAGTLSDTIAITLLRTLKLRTQTVRLNLKLEPNEYFQLPIETYKNGYSWSSTSTINSGISYLFKFNEKYSKPFSWDWFAVDNFGTFSINKYLLLNELMDWAIRDWTYAGMSGAKITAGKMNYAARLMQKYLQDKANAGTPVLDDDGSYMQLTDSYRVDYSHLK